MYAYIYINKTLAWQQPPCSTRHPEVQPLRAAPGGPVGARVDDPRHNLKLVQVTVIWIYTK